MEWNRPVCIDEKTRLEHAICFGRTGTGKTSSFLLPVAKETLDVKIKNINVQKQAVLDLIESKDIYQIDNFDDIDFCLDYFRACTEKGKKALSTLRRNAESATLVTISSDASLSEGIEEMCNNANIGCIRIDPMLYAGVDPENPHRYGFNPMYISPILEGEALYLDIVYRADIISKVLKEYELTKGKESPSFFTGLSQRVLCEIIQVLMLSYQHLHKGNHPTLLDVFYILEDYTRLTPYLAKMAELYGSKGKPRTTKVTHINDSRIDCGEALQLIYHCGCGLVNSKSTDKVVTEVTGLKTQLENLLKILPVRRLLCDQKSVDLPMAVRESRVILFNTQKSIGDDESRALGQLYLMSYDRAILNRPKDDRRADVDPEPISFLLADEISSYIGAPQESIVTLHRGYRSGTYMCLQTDSQFDRTEALRYLKNIMKENPALRIRMGGMLAEEAKEFEALSKTVEKTYRTRQDGGWTLISNREPQYSSQQLQMLPFKHCSIQLIKEGTPQFVQVVRTQWVGNTFRDRVFEYEWPLRFLARPRIGMFVPQEELPEEVDTDIFFNPLGMPESVDELFMTQEEKEKAKRENDSTPPYTVHVSNDPIGEVLKRRAADDSKVETEEKQTGMNSPDYQTKMEKVPFFHPESISQRCVEDEKLKSLLFPVTV